MAWAGQYYEDSVRDGYYPNHMRVTDESAIVGIDVDSMAGSGVSVFADFGDAVCWFWRVCEDQWGSGGKDSWIPDAQAPVELREGRARFRALLSRFIDEGYTRDMAQELHDTVYAVLGGGWAVGGYEVSGVSVLPDDLEDVLERFGNPLEYDDDGEPIEVPAGTSAPKFDLDNPEHFEALQRWLEKAASDE